MKMKNMIGIHCMGHNIGINTKMNKKEVTGNHILNLSPTQHKSVNEKNTDRRGLEHGTFASIAYGSNNWANETYGKERSILYLL